MKALRLPQASLSMIDFDPAADPDPEPSPTSEPLRSNWIANVMWVIVGLVALRLSIWLWPLYVLVGVGIGVNKLLVDSAPDLTRRQRRRAATGTAALLGIVVVGGPPGWALGLLALGVLLGFLRAKPVVESGLITFGGAALGVGIAVAIVGYAVAGLVGAMFACPFAVGHWIARSNLANRNK